MRREDDWDRDTERVLNRLEWIRDSLDEQRPYLEKMADQLERIADALTDRQDSRGVQIPFTVPGSSGDVGYPLLVLKAEIEDGVPSVITGEATDVGPDVDYAWTFQYQRGRWRLSVTEYWSKTPVLTKTGLYGAPTDSTIDWATVKRITEPWLLWPPGGPRDL